MRVMDVGCGPGTITVGMAEVVAPGRVDGFDLQPALVKRARAIASERRVQNVNFSVANVYRLPFSARTFDAVFANPLLMFVSNPLAALTEIRRVLRPAEWWACAIPISAAKSRRRPRRCPTNGSSFGRPSAN